MKNLLVSALTAALVVVCFQVLRYAEASRNSSGTMALSTPGVPFQSNQVISSTQVNNTFNDIATEITASLERSGKGGMLAALRGVDGTLAAPAFSWTSETGSGLFRNAASDVRMAIAGSLREQWTSTGVAITGTATVSSTLGVTGATTLSSTLALSDVLTQTLPGTASSINKSLEATLADGNSVQYRLGKSDSSNESGALTYAKNATAANSTLCLDVVGQSSTICVNGNGRTAVGGAGGLLVNVGVGADGSGFKHKRGTAGCATAAAAGATCTTTVTWTTAFADSNYDAVCFGRVATSGVPAISQINNGGSASQTIVTTTAITAAAAQFTNIDCIAVHD